MIKLLCLSTLIPLGWSQPVLDYHSDLVHHLQVNTSLIYEDDASEAPPKETDGASVSWIRIVGHAFLVMSVCLNVVLLNYIIAKAQRRRRRYWP